MAWPVLDPKKISLPDTYVLEPRERIALYRRFSVLKSIRELDAMREELFDRYGQMDDRVLSVFQYLQTMVVATC